MNPGQRIRFNEHSPWPERVGCEGVVVAPRADGIYPQPAKDEVLILLDDDPLSDHPAWTCVTDRKSLDLVN